MARHIGPVEKLSRREGVQLHLKGERLAAGKSALERRPHPPGEHGRRHRRLSEYALQLREKQRLKRYYGMRERELRRAFDRRRREPGTPGENLLRLLERRLDNVVYRLGFAGTRSQARQFVVHGHVLVDGAKVDRPSYAVSGGETVDVAALTAATAGLPQPACRQRATIAAKAATPPRRRRSPRRPTTTAPSHG